LKTVADTVADY